jgi:hypothetical protein
MTTEEIISRLIHADSQLSYWRRQRKSLSTLIAPRTDWELLKWTRAYRSYMQMFLARIDDFITTDQLYESIRR